MTDLQSVALAVWLRRLNCYARYCILKNESRKGLFKIFFFFCRATLKREDWGNEAVLSRRVFDAANLLAHRVDDARGQKRTQRRFFARAGDFFD